MTPQLNVRLCVEFHAIARQSQKQVALPPSMLSAEYDRKWYAVFTYPQHEKSVAKQLDLREIESFLPTYETIRVWKNRQRMKITLPLFPTYLFVHIHPTQRSKVVQAPGVLQIVGSARESIALPESEIEFLRTGTLGKWIEPFCDLVIGTKVRIKSGVMQGVEGTLVRKGENMRFVLTLELLNSYERNAESAARCGLRLTPSGFLRAHYNQESNRKLAMNLLTRFVRHLRFPACGPQPLQFPANRPL